MSINPTLLQTEILETESQLISMSAFLRGNQGSPLNPLCVVTCVLYEQQKDHFKSLWELKTQREGRQFRTVVPPFCPYFPTYSFRIPERYRLPGSRDCIVQIGELFLKKIILISKEKREYAKSYGQIEDPQLYQLNLDSLLQCYKSLISYRTAFSHLLKTIDPPCLSQRPPQSPMRVVYSVNMVFTATIP